MARIIFFYESHDDYRTVDAINILSARFKEANITSLGIERPSDEVPLKTTEVLDKERENFINIFNDLRKLATKPAFFEKLNDFIFQNLAFMIPQDLLALIKSTDDVSQLTSYYSD